MNLNKLIPMITTADIKATKAFYVDQLGFDIVFDMPNYLHVSYNNGPELAFMPGGEFPPMGKGVHRQTFTGVGLAISIPTVSADKKAEEFKAKGIELMMDVEDKPWGWRSVFIVDPNGLVLDFSHELEAAKDKTAAA